MIYLAIKNIGVGSNQTCVDIDECLGQNPCGRGTCVNEEGGYDCSCEAGFVFEAGSGCQDLNECSLYFNPCGMGRGECTNQQPGYSCVCGKGFRLSEGINKPPPASRSNKVQKSLEKLHFFKVILDLSALI